jgi:hypothetical protein
MSDTEQPEIEDGPVVPPADFLSTQEEARRLGMTNRWSVRLRTLPEFKHLLPTGEDGGRWGVRDAVLRQAGG